MGSNCSLPTDLPSHLFNDMVEAGQYYTVTSESNVAEQLLNTSCSVECNNLIQSP